MDASPASCTTADTPAPSEPPAPVVVRRGRGVFSAGLRVDQASGGGCSKTTTATATAIATDASAVQTARLRDGFGEHCDEGSYEPTDTLRQLFFRQEKRSRYYLFGGETAPTGGAELRIQLYARRIPTPAYLRRKKGLRLIHLSLRAPAAPTAESSQDLSPVPDATDARAESEVTNKAAMLIDLPGSSASRDPVLSSRSYRCMSTFFENELTSFLSLEDVRVSTVTVRVHFGGSYLCASSNSMFGDHHIRWTLPGLQQAIADESVKLFFLREVAPPVQEALRSRRAKATVYGKSTLTLVKLCVLETTGNQQRICARALWDEVTNCFRLLDCESFGASVAYTVFPLPEKQPPLPLYAAYPFEVEYRTFRRWKQSAPTNSSGVYSHIHNMLQVLSSSVGKRNEETNFFKPLKQVDFSSVLTGTADSRPQEDSMGEGKNDEFSIESVTMEEITRERVSQSGLLLDTTRTTLFDNFSSPDRPPSYSTGFSFTSSCLYWKLKPGTSPAENAALVADALSFATAVVDEANKFRGPRGPTA